MFYRLVVTQHGGHHFATASNSVVSEERARQLFNDFKKRFPSDEGFNVQVTLWKTEGIKQDYF